MEEVIQWYLHLPMPFKIGLWVLAFLLILSVAKRLLKLAILVTILIILMFVLRAVVQNL